MTDTLSSIAQEPFAPLIAWLIEQAVAESTLPPVLWESATEDLAIRLSIITRPVLDKEVLLRAARKDAMRTLAGHAQTPENIESARAELLSESPADSWAAVFRKYPVLDRLVRTLIADWKKNISELRQRLESDWPEILATFSPEKNPGPLAQIYLGLSDPHHGGGSVAELVFAGGWRLIYKPRPLQIDERFQTLLAWLNARGAEPPFRITQLLDRGNYGWVEFIHAVSCEHREGVREAYRGYGALLCLFYLLGETDAHLENVIVSGQEPVAVDVETLFQPVGTAFPENHRLSTDNALRTGLLPTEVLLEDGWISDSSAWGAFEGPQVSHLPSLAGQPQPAYKFATEITEGFALLYELILANRELLREPDSTLFTLADCEVRYLYRSTVKYAEMMRMLIQPHHLRSEERFNQELKGVIGGASPFFDQEKADLSRLDVPRIMLSPRETGPLRPEPPIQAVRNRLDRLDSADLRHQQQLLHNSLRILGFRSLPVAYHDPISAQVVAGTQALTLPAALDESRRIAALLEETAISTLDGGLTWLTFQASKNTQGKYRHEPVDDGLYQGVIGIALFLATLHSVQPEPRWRELCLKALAPFRSGNGSGMSTLLAEPGLACGTSSVIYGLAKIGRMLDEPALLATAVHWAREIPDTIGDDDQFDVLSGTAGAIIALLALYEVHHDPEILDAAITCGDHLLAHRTQQAGGLRGWLAHGTSIFYLGAAHGQTGIALALDRLADASGVESYRLAAKEALALEDHYFDAAVQNWPWASESGSAPPTLNWCYGAPGITISRLGMTSAASALPTLTALIERNIDQPLHSIDHLCCGNFGRLDVLVEASIRLDRSDLLTAARRRAACLVHRTNSEFSYGLTPDFPQPLLNPTLFRGLAGIGYQLLRLAYPQRVPSILAWQ